MKGQFSAPTSSTCECGSCPEKAVVYVEGKGNLCQKHIANFMQYTAQEMASLLQSMGLLRREKPALEQAKS